MLGTSNVGIEKLGASKLGAVKLGKVNEGAVVDLATATRFFVPFGPRVAESSSSSRSMI